MEKAQIGVFGGSGFYQFGEDVEKIKVDTPYGMPSSQIFIATIEGKRVAFLPRHGVDHSYPPHMINYRANVWAMKELGVKFLIGPCASGSLQMDIKPGEFVFCDQFVNETFSRKDTFYDGPVATHINCSQPYCPSLRELSFKIIDKLDIPYHKTGTVVTINGPRFASGAESKDYTARGWHVINMTQYPEAVLARELEMCYLNISLITDYDCGLEQQVAKTEIKEIIAVFNKNLENVKKFLFALIKEMPTEATCSCQHALDGARF
jgi:5'-methylthioadenosine phosphorylase